MDPKILSYPIDLDYNAILNTKLNPMTSSARLAYGTTLGVSDAGNIVYDLDETKYFYWNGTSWSPIGSGDQANWTETDPSSPSFIQNKPVLADVATSGDFNDLINKPTTQTYKDEIFQSGNLITGPNAGIAVATNPGQYFRVDTAYNTPVDDGVNSVSVGGASVHPASYWKTKNLREVFDEILFPDQLPTYTIPTIGLGYSGTAGIKEIGSTLGGTFTILGTKNDAGAYQPFKLQRAATTLTIGATSSVATPNVPDQFGYINPNSPNLLYTATYNENFVVPSGNTVYTASVDYAAGLPKKNNKGVVDSRTPLVRSTAAPQASSTGFTATTITITGIYPYFWQVFNTQPSISDIQSAVTNNQMNKVLADSTGTITINWNASAQYLVFLTPSISTTKTSYFVTGLNTGPIGGAVSPSGNLFPSPALANITTPLGYWSNVSYKIYISNYVTNSDPINPAMQLRN